MTGERYWNFGLSITNPIRTVFNPNYAIGGAKSSELLALVGVTPI
jgi:hypothetical protein